VGFADALYGAGENYGHPGMIKRFDIRIIELIDRCTTAMQRRGMLPLNTLIMGNECLFWTTGIAATRGFDWFLYLLAAVSLSMGFVRWRNAHGYWESYRKAQELNARVLRVRDYWHLRLSVACFALVMVLLIDLPIWRLMGILNSVTLVFMMYLNCCRYLGPGDFAREKRESLSGAFESTQA
jgi:hypothetical protein